jgi:transcriptional regulator with GAF, ATPase, and Fis domain
MATLWVKDDEGDRVFPLREGTTILGRAADATIRVSASGVSQQHAELMDTPSGLRVRDLGSSNGVTINGASVQECLLSDGDRIVLGQAMLIYSAAPHVPVAAATTDEVAPARIEMLLRVARCVLGAELGLENLLSLTVDLLVSELGAARCFVVLATPDGHLDFHAARNLDRRDIQSPALEASRSVVTHVLQTGSPALVADMAQDQHFHHQESVQALGLRSLVAAPIRVGAEVRGVLYLDDPRLPNRFSPADCTFLAQAGDLVGRSLDNARAFEQSEQSLASTQERLRQAEEELRSVKRLGRLVSRSPRMHEAMDLSRRAAGSGHPLLITGETGTGKELLARAIHGESQRAGGAFVAVNCAALVEGLLESELFGHVKGAFSGAHDDHIGLCMQATSGTLFLDEVEEMSPSLQAKLLRVLEDGTFRPVGSNDEARTEARIVAATNEDLLDMVRAGFFREDLYYRLSVLQVRLPPLRERREDVPLLAAHLLGLEGGRTLDTEGIGLLSAHDWPGNVRELHNVIREVCALVPTGTVPAEFVAKRLKVAASSGGEPAGRSFAEARAHFERSLVDKALARSRGNIAAAARELRMDRGQLHKTVRRMGLNPAAYKTR